MKIALLVAMDKEFELIGKILDKPVIKKIKHLDFMLGLVDENQIILVKSGIGKVSAAVAALETINNFAPDYIISTGVAGGISKNLKIMDMVVANALAYHDVWCGDENDYGQIQGLPPRFISDTILLDKVKTMGIANLCGLIVSGDKFISKKDEINYIAEKFPDALAVDMESAAIAQVCFLYKIPFIALRIISDTPGIDNHSEQYKGFWQEAPSLSLQAIESLIKSV